MNCFHHKDLGNHVLQLCPKVVKHPVYKKSCTSQPEDGFRKKAETCSCHDVLITFQTYISCNKGYVRQSSYIQCLTQLQSSVPFLLWYCGSRCGPRDSVSVPCRHSRVPGSVWGRTDITNAFWSYRCTATAVV